MNLCSFYQFVTSQIPWPSINACFLVLQFHHLFPIIFFFLLSRASSSNVSQELERLKKLLADATKMLDSQAREIGALKTALEAKNAEIEHLRMQIWSEELRQSMLQPPTTMESGRTLADVVRHWRTR